MLALVRRDLALAWRASGGALTGLLFFLATVAVVPFAVGPDLPLLARIGPAIVWLGALLASLLGLDRLFTLDREDGSLDVLMGAPASLALMALAKIVAHWLATGLPLVVAAPVLGLMVNLDAGAALRTAATLLVGTPALAALGGVGAAVAVALPRGGLLVAVLVLPLAVPTLVFGVAAARGDGGAMALLAATTLFALALAPPACAAALRAAAQ